jgi:phosphoglycolate phosphatase-like HAD superfamily hydrolase
LGITREGLERIVHEQWVDVSGVTLFPDVTGVLEGLRRKNVKTGIISNAYEEEINTICTRVGLDGFDVVVG